MFGWLSEEDASMQAVKYYSHPLIFSSSSSPTALPDLSLLHCSSQTGLWTRDSIQQHTVSTLMDALRSIEGAD
jgi:hypothetical protein